VTAVAFDVEAVRARFSALQQGLVFFDGPGGTQVPDEVIDAIAGYYRADNANLGGEFDTSRRSERIVSDARIAAAGFLGCTPDEVAFGQNTTTLNFALTRALGRELQPGDEILCTRLDHDANVAPWLAIAEDKSMTVRWLDFDPATGRWSLDDLRALLGPKTKLLAIGGASNALGTLNPIAEACALVRAESNALTYIDAVQSVPHVVTDVTAIGCDFLACSPYKFFGPHQGVLWMRQGLAPRAYKVRPAGDDGAHRFETGTPSFEGQAGVLGTVSYLEWLGGEVDPAANSRRARLVAAMTAAAAYERGLGERMLAGLTAIRGLKLWGPPSMDGRVPTFSFTLAGHDAHAVAEHLAGRDIFAWAGHFYAVEAVDRLRLADSGGLLRVGLCHYNTAAEVDRLLAALAEL
jgi:cysteine desulfurase family protein (TIGR01976 family)